MIHFYFSHIDDFDPSKAIFAVSRTEQQVLREIFHTLGYTPDDPLIERLKRLPRKGHKKQHKRCFVPDKNEPPLVEIFVAEIQGDSSGVNGTKLKLDTEGLRIEVDWKEMLTKFFQCIKSNAPPSKLDKSLSGISGLISYRH